MCGILGFVTKNKCDLSTWLTSAIDSLKHRGPDDQGQWINKELNIGMGHTRLSIFDLSSSGRQPMSSFSERFIITFNGEIYNFIEIRKKLINLGIKFKSDTDTEVFVNAFEIWGEKCLSMFIGMFAAAIFDNKLKKLYLLRDIAGEKPLYFFKSEDVFLFSSELQALFKCPLVDKKISIFNLTHYFHYRVSPSSNTLIENIHKVNPGSILEINTDNLSLKSNYFYKLPDNSESINLDQQEQENELEKLLLSSVENQLRADVPVAVLLSGGVDSSLIASFAAQKLNKVSTFTVSFPNNPQHDESAHAKKISNYLGTNHEVVNAQSPSIDLLQKLVSTYDDPIADSSMIPTFMISEVISKQFKVALGGDGADELFGGYHLYSRLPKILNLNKLTPNFVGELIKDICNFLPYGVKGINYLTLLSTDLYENPTAPRFSINKNNSYKLINKSFQNKYQNRISNQNFSFISDLAMRYDFQNYLPGDILIKVDRASMAHGLEIRSPFLDRRVVDFAFGKLSLDAKVSGNQKKIILKNILKRRIPINFNYYRKQGFSVPMNKWLKKGSAFRSFFYDILTNPKILHKKEVNKYLKAQNMGLQNGENIFMLAMFEHWSNKYNTYI